VIWRISTANAAQ